MNRKPPPENTKNAQPESREDTRRRHRRRSRLLMLRRLLVLTLVVTLAVVLWFNWDTLAPDKLLAKFRDSMNAADGSFPVDIAGTDVTMMVPCGNHIATLSESYLTFYNSSGGELNRYTCTFSAPLYRTAGDYVLLAEQDGKRVQLYTRTAMQVEVTAKERILTVALTENGHFAVVTRGTQNYTAQVTVYDREGNQLYSRSRSKLATGVALSPNGEHLALLSIETTGGVLSSHVEVFTLSGTETAAVYTHTLRNALLYRLEYMTKDTLAAIGETGALLVDTAAKTTTPYTVDGQRVLGCAVKEDGVALSLRDYGDTAGGTVLMLDATGKQAGTVSFTGEFRHLTTDGDLYLLLTDTAAQSLSHTGVEASAAIEADGQRAVLTGDTAVVLGLNSIQAYTLDG